MVQVFFLMYNCNDFMCDQLVQWMCTESTPKTLSLKLKEGDDHPKCFVKRAGGETLGAILGNTARKDW